MTDEIEISDLDKLKILWGEDKAISAILTQVDKYCEHLQESQDELTSRQKKRVEAFARRKIDEMHERGRIPDKRYQKITSKLINIYPTRKPRKED